jgi:alpha-beta hydrolase superfamily lysophospholipase
MHTDAHRIESTDGITISLRERSAPDPDAAVVFVHGATYAGRAVFDPRDAPEYSWLAWAADAGRAAFAVDIRGYGDSDRPPAMDDGDASERPPARAPEAATDVAAAIEAVRERFACPVHLVGTSWGTMIAGRLLSAADAPEVASVTLHAPVFEPDPSLLDGMVRDPPPTRTVSRAEVLSRWNEQIHTDPPAAIRDGTAGSDPVFDAFWASLTGSGQGVDGGDAIVAPNGTLADLAAGSAGDPPYDPEAIDVPTLVVRGSLDPTSTREDALGVYDRLSVPDDEAVYAGIEGGTHFVHLERRRTALYRTVDAFQSDVDPAR